jgi:hypothetical protein
MLGPPLFRILCHCTICQRFNDAPFADVVVYDASSVGEPCPGTVDYDTYKPPPNLKRGKCAACGAAAIEKLALPLLPKLTMVPAVVHGSDAGLPAPKTHIFYGTRVAEAEDALPKQVGFIASQLTFARHFISAKVSRK